MDIILIADYIYDMKDRLIKAVAMDDNKATQKPIDMIMQVEE